MTVPTTHSEIDEQLAERLRERGLRVTSQRLVIHRALRARDQHLTAEQVLDAIADALPGTSLPTVYATLELLEELGLARRVSTGTGPLLFDSRVSPHAHTVCRRCGTLADLEQPVESGGALALARATGFAPDHAQLVIWGLCARCQAELAAPPAG
jgi:Fe2+ or Zn2+ uptake regulation protein